MSIFQGEHAPVVEGRMTMVREAVREVLSLFEQPAGDDLEPRLVRALDRLVAAIHEVRFEHTSEADALWHFENGFHLHWAAHVRWLQVYLLWRWLEG